MPNINIVFLAGHLTKDPEIKTVGAKETTLARFTLAVNDGFGDNKQAHFHNVNAWGKTAEACGKFLKKGSAAMIEGRLLNNNYEDKDGVKHYGYQVTADKLHLLGGGGTKKTKQTPKADVEEIDLDDYDLDDMPF